MKFDVPMKSATKRETGASYTSRGRPICSMCPLRMTAIRLDIASASI